MHRVALYWVRRDLRLTDNPALLAALRQAERIVIAYVHAPDEEAPWQPGAASRVWLHASLKSLCKELSKRGGSLCIRRGPTLSALRMLISESGATLVVWNRHYEPALLHRDRAIETELASSGIEVQHFNSALWFDPWELATQRGEPFRVFTPFWRACSQRLHALPTPLAAPRRIAALNRRFPSAALDELHLMPRAPWSRSVIWHWHPGEVGAQQALRRFATEIAAHYSRTRDTPIADTSRLSPHLHFGELSPRQIIAALRAKFSQDAANQAYLRQLAWREFAHHLLHHFPTTHSEPFDKRFRTFEWKDHADALRTWQQGRTGFPVVDAGMRELWATGYMHNRVRMLVASFLTKNLRIHWLEGARWFWDTLVDADLANNTLGWQWVAGCGTDAAPYFRIFNPILQSQRFDPEGEYLRRWLPELARLPNRFIHAPHMAPTDVLRAAGIELGRTYPKPIVDLNLSRVQALEAYKAIKKRRGGSS